MPSERQSESARINGAKSHGPKSPEGKEKSSRNSLRHGCTAGHTLLLACEDRGDFDRMFEKYNDMYKPTTLEEQDLVSEMASARWRIRRATGIETALIDLEVVTEEPKVRAKFVTVDGGMLLASAFRSLADESNAMNLLSRYESRLRRIHKQAHAMLLRLRPDLQSEPALPEPPPAPAPAPDLAPAPDGPEVCTPPTPATPPPAILVPSRDLSLDRHGADEPVPLTPKPEARCSRENKIRVGQAIRLPISHGNKGLQNEPPAAPPASLSQSQRAKNLQRGKSTGGKELKTSCKNARPHRLAEWGRPIAPSSGLAAHPVKANTPCYLGATGQAGDSVLNPDSILNPE